jgi:hypothetical protein
MCFLSHNWGKWKLYKNQATYDNYGIFYGYADWYRRQCEDCLKVQSKGAWQIR